MKFACEQCGKKYVLSEERAGGRENVRIKCRVCGHVIVVKKEGQIVIPLEDEGAAGRPATSLPPEPMPSEIPPPPVPPGVAASQEIESGSLQPVEVPSSQAEPASAQPPPPLPPLPAPPRAENAHLAPSPPAAVAPVMPGKIPSESPHADVLASPGKNRVAWILGLAAGAVLLAVIVANC